MDRRTLLKVAGTAAGMAMVGGAAEAAAQGKKLCFDNAGFYQDGKFQLEKGRDAVLEMCKFHGYPVFPGMREKLVAIDYDTGEYTKIGLACVMFMNNVDDQYMLMDIFLLPGQMLPEHWHESADGRPAKREGWLVRWGTSHIVGIGEPNLTKDIVIPKCHCGGKVEVEHQVVATPGMFVPLAKVGTKHWQYAGPEGAIITEVANVHTDAAVRHSDPKLNEYFLSLLKK